MHIQRLTLLLLVLASMGALALAFVVQYGLGYAPCSLCVLARWPHVLVIALGLGALAVGWPRFGLGAAAVALLAAFAISLRHMGVEAGWLPLPDACQVGAVATGLEGLRSAMLAQTQPGCDVGGPAVLGVSMAGWHALAALALAGLATLALSAPRQAQR